MGACTCEAGTQGCVPLLGWGLSSLSKGIALLTFWDKILLSLAASLASTHQMPAEVVTTRNIVDLANVPWKAKSPLFGAPVSETSQAMMRSVVLSFKEVVFFSETWWC